MVSYRQEITIEDGDGDFRTTSARLSRRDPDKDFIPHTKTGTVLVCGDVMQKIIWIMLWNVGQHHWASRKTE